MPPPSRFDRWIFSSFAVSPTGLALYRICYAAFTLLVIAPGHDAYVDFSSLSSLPSAFFLPPPGPMMLMPGFPPSLFFDGLLLLLNLSLVALLFGYRTRWASLATGLLFLVGYGFSYSLGKINHNLLFVLLPVLMAFSNWGAALSLDARSGRGPREVQTWPLMMLALLLGFAMFTAGFAKVLGGWLDPATHATQGHLVKHFFVRGRTDLLAPFFLSVESDLFWEAVDCVTVAFEIGFLAAILRPSTTRLFAGLAVVFHFMVMAMLNIAFTFNVIVYAAFIDWDEAAAWVRSRRPASLRRPLPRAGALQIGLAVAAGTLFFFWLGSPLIWLDTFFVFASDLTGKEVVTLCIALGVVVWLGVRGALPLVRRLVSGCPRPRVSSLS